MFERIEYAGREELGACLGGCGGLGDCWEDVWEQLWHDPDNLNQNNAYSGFWQTYLFNLMSCNLTFAIQKMFFLKRSCSLRYFANSKYGFSCAQLCCSWAKRSASTDHTCSRSYIQRSMVMPLLWPLENHSSSRDLASSTTLCCLVYDMTSISSPLPVFSVFGQWNHSLSTVLDHSFQ